MTRDHARFEFYRRNAAFQKYVEQFGRYRRANAAGNRRESDRARACTRGAFEVYLDVLETARRVSN